MSPSATPRGLQFPGGRRSPTPVRDRSRERQTFGTSRRVFGIRVAIKRGSRTLSRGSGSSGPTAVESEPADMGQPGSRARRRMA
eukprot:6307871-Lingulodinium_polyedra.AAC.1